MPGDCDKELVTRDEEKEVAKCLREEARKEAAAAKEVAKLAQAAKKKRG